MLPPSSSCIAPWFHRLVASAVVLYFFGRQIDTCRTTFRSGSHAKTACGTEPGKSRRLHDGCWDWPGQNHFAQFGCLCKKAYPKRRIMSPPAPISGMVNAGAVPAPHCFPSRPVAPPFLSAAISALRLTGVAGAALACRRLRPRAGSTAPNSQANCLQVAAEPILARSMAMRKVCAVFRGSAVLWPGWTAAGLSAA